MRKLLSTLLLLAACDNGGGMPDTDASPAAVDADPATLATVVFHVHPPSPCTGADTLTATSGSTVAQTVTAACTGGDYIGTLQLPAGYYSITLSGPYPRALGMLLITPGMIGHTTRFDY